MKQDTEILLRTLLKLLYGGFKLAVVLVLGFVAFMFYIFNGWGAQFNVYAASFILLAAEILLLFSWVFPIRNKLRLGAALGGAALALAGVIALGACLGQNAYLDSIVITDNSQIDTREYRAFDPDSKIPRLGREASLRFGKGDDLPVLDGAAAFFPLYSAFVEAVYPRWILPLNYPGTESNPSPYRYHNTIEGYRELVEGKNDILFAFGPDEEAESYAAEEGVSFELIPLGREAFVFFTNAKNPVFDLTVDQLRGIYSGKIGNWAELGGRDEKILPYQRNEGSGSQTGLHQFMGDVPLMDPPTELVNSFMWGIIEEIADYRNHRGAIGFSYRFYAEEVVANPDIRLFSVNGVEPTEENVKNGSYPILMDFYMVVREGSRTEEADRLIGWALSEEGQTLVEMAGYAPIGTSSRERVSR